jgi:hypothetical protein
MFIYIGASEYLEKNKFPLRTSRLYLATVAEEISNAFKKLVLQTSPTPGMKKFTLVRTPVERERAGLACSIDRSTESVVMMQIFFSRDDKA